MRRETNVEVQKPACKKGLNRIRYVAYAKQTPVEANGDLRTTQGNMEISLREGLAIGSTAHLILEPWCVYDIKQAYPVQDLLLQCREALPQCCGGGIVLEIRHRGRVAYR